jgi:membrane associated rhomboid family serine protease
VNAHRERIFNVPFIVLALAVFIGMVHALLALVLTHAQALEILLMFSFIPRRYDLLATESWTLGWGPAIWSPITYAFIHTDFTHVLFNEVWLIAFGTPVARRFGLLRFAAFFALTAAAGAAAHFISRPGDPLPVIGASAAVSGMMAAAMRFVFQRGGPLAGLGGDDASYRMPAVPLSAMLRDPRALGFIAVWFGVNLLFGLGTVAMPGMEGQSVAWEAHIGGFVAGLFAFSLFDSVRNPPLDDGWSAPPTAPQS